MVSADAAVKLAASAGLVLDPWQDSLLRRSLETGEDGRWRHFEAAAIVPRQNGKGAVLEARELAGLFLDDDCRLIIHSAHEFSTSLEAFARLLDDIEAAGLMHRVERVTRSHGEEGITLDDGSRIRFKTRTASGGRGLSADLLILDEAMILREAALAALLPTLSARPNPNVWYTGSAVNEEIHEHGVVLARVRERGHAQDPHLAFAECCAPHELADLLADPALLDDPVVWAAANPAVAAGRMRLDHIARERASMSARAFAVERLGAGAWPNTDPTVASLIEAGVWDALADADSQPAGPLVLAFDVTPDRGSTAIAIAGRREDSRVHVELVDTRAGTAWAPERIAELVESHDIATVRCDGISGAASLVADLSARGVKVEKLSGREYADGCAEFFDAATQDGLRHVPAPELDAAVAGAATRSLGEAWAWARKTSRADISPLVAATLAMYASAPVEAEEFEFSFG